MADQPPERCSTHNMRTHPAGPAHGRTKWLAIVVAVKLIAVAAVVGLFWLLQVRFAIGASAMILLHVAFVGALLALGMRSHLLRRRRNRDREA